MRLLIAFILPWLTFFTIGRPVAGLVCLILQLTVLGWIPATIWAVYALSQYSTDRKIEKALGSQKLKHPCTGHNLIARRREGHRRAGQISRWRRRSAAARHVRAQSHAADRTARRTSGRSGIESLSDSRRTASR